MSSPKGWLHDLSLGDGSGVDEMDDKGVDGLLSSFCVDSFVAVSATIPIGFEDADGKEADGTEAEEYAAGLDVDVSVTFAIGCENADGKETDGIEADEYAAG